MKKRFLKNKIQKLLFGIYNDRSSSISPVGVSHTIIPASFEDKFPHHNGAKVSKNITYIP